MNYAVLIPCRMIGPREHIVMYIGCFRYIVVQPDLDAQGLTKLYIVENNFKSKAPPPSPQLHSENRCRNNIAAVEILICGGKNFC